MLWFHDDDDVVAVVVYLVSMLELLLLNFFVDIIIHSKYVDRW